MAESLNNLAVLYRNQGKYAEAEPLLKWALDIQEKALGPDHPNVARSLNNLADIYSNQGKYAEAEPLYKRSLAIREKTFGPDHPNVADSLRSLALLYWNQGRYAEAEPLYKRSLAIREKIFGPELTQVAVSLNDLAAIYCDEGRYEEAEPLFQRALAIREKTTGPRSREAASAVRVLAACEFKERKFSDALDRLVHCSQIARELSAKTPKDQKLRFLMGSVLLLKGQIEAAMGRSSEGQSSWKEALATLGPTAKGAQSTSDQDTYAQILLCLGRTEEAKPIVKRLLDGGYKDPDFLALCREKGLMPKEPPGRKKQ